MPIQGSAGWQADQQVVAGLIDSRLSYLWAQRRTGAGTRSICERSNVGCQLSNLGVRQLPRPGRHSSGFPVANCIDDLLGAEPGLDRPASEIRCALGLNAFPVGSV